jgi:hypothetical protein
MGQAHPRPIDKRLDCPKMPGAVLSLVIPEQMA